MYAASEIDIPDTVASCHKLDNRVICNMTTVTKMEIMKILSEPGNGEYSSIRKVSAFCKYQIA